MQTIQFHKSRLFETGLIILDFNVFVQSKQRRIIQYKTQQN